MSARQGRGADTGSRHDERGQALALFAGSLLAIAAVAALLVDVGLGWSNDRMAQSAVDTAVLAAGKAYAAPPKDDAKALAAAREVAAANGFEANYTDCDGNTRTDGVTVEYPPTTGDFAGEDGYVEVTVTRPLQTTFAAALGQDCWMITSRAVAQTSKYTTSTTTTTVPDPYPTVVALRQTCDVTIKWNGHDGTIYGNIQSNGPIDNTGEPSNQVVDGTVVQTDGCPETPHPLGTYTSETFTSPWQWNLSDFHCQAGTLPGKFNITSTLADGTYCATDSITVKYNGLTGRYTFIAPKVTFNATDINLLPFENGVLAWATAGVPCTPAAKGGGDGIVVDGANSTWSGIVYAPCSDVHVTAKAGTVVDGNIWAWNVEMGGDGWSIRGLGAGTTTTTTTFEEIFEQAVRLVE